MSQEKQVGRFAQRVLQAMHEQDKSIRDVAEGIEYTSPMFASPSR
jgi:hypothetical protein